MKHNHRDKKSNRAPIIANYSFIPKSLHHWVYSLVQTEWELLTAYRHVLESMKTISNDELMVARKQFWNSLNHDLDFDDAWSEVLLVALENHYSLKELPLYEQIINRISTHDLEQRAKQLFGNHSQHFYSYLFPESAH